MASRLAFNVLAVAAILFSLVLAEDLELCGETRYYPSEYTCYNNTTICPILFGLASLPCDGACYSGEMYECKSGSLNLLSEATDPFTITAHGTSNHVSGQTVKACGNYLALGAGARECTSCSQSPLQSQCGAYQNKTVLLSNGEMAADFPGGQFWYVNVTDGALMFSEGGKANGPEVFLAGQSVTVYNHGFFSYDEAPHYWLACLRTLPGGTPGTSRVYRIYAPTPSNLQRTDCEQIKLISESVADRKQGAYKYE